LGLWISSTLTNQKKITLYTNILQESKKKKLLNKRKQTKETKHKGSKHVTRSQKGSWMLNIINQNQTFIFLLPFKTIIIMAS
jgi:hypothetical protein